MVAVEGNSTATWASEAEAEDGLLLLRVGVKLVYHRPKENSRRSRARACHLCDQPLAIHSRMELISSTKVSCHIALPWPERAKPNLFENLGTPEMLPPLVTAPWVLVAPEKASLEPRAYTLRLRDINAPMTEPHMANTQTP